MLDRSLVDAVPSLMIGERAAEMPAAVSRLLESHISANRKLRGCTPKRKLQPSAKLFLSHDEPITLPDVPMVQMPDDVLSITTNFKTTSFGRTSSFVLTRVFKVSLLFWVVAGLILLGRLLIRYRRQLESVAPNLIASKKTNLEERGIRRLFRGRQRSYGSRTGIVHL